MSFASQIKSMEQFLISTLISFINSLPADNPAYLDILKLVVGSIGWIGGLGIYMYWRERKLKTAVIKK
jgi:hypothetical protein